jgi:DNA ligase-1
MNNPWNIIKELESDNSRLAKEAIIKREADVGNDEFFAGCKLALDSMITFGVKKVPESSASGPGLPWDEFLNLVVQLSLRQLTGNAAQEAVQKAMNRSTVEQWNDWYRRILIKDMRAGFSEKTVNSVVEKLNAKEYVIPVFTCQLAHDSANHETKVTGEKLIEVKLDGVRVIAIVNPNGHVSLFSRNGKQLDNFPLVEQQLSRRAGVFSEPVVVDGEIMSASFQDLMKQVHRKSDVKSSDAVLNLFDMITLKEFQEGRGIYRQIDRSVTLAAWYNQVADDLPNVTIVGQERVDLNSPAGQARFRQINQEAIDGGYEGIMIKDLEAVYECKRSTAWLKLKPFIEVTLEVVDVEEGTGRNQGRLGALVCSGQDDGRDITVNCGSGFSDSDRGIFWESRGQLVGQLVEVRADAVTKNQDGTYSLRFPRFLRFRGFEPGEKI